MTTSDHCIVCDSADLGEPVEINNGWHMRVCGKCQAGTTWPTPTGEQMAATNAETYPLDVRVAIYTSRAAEFRARADQLMELLPVRPSSLLDFGCNLGFFLADAKKRGWRESQAWKSTRLAAHGAPPR